MRVWVTALVDLQKDSQVVVQHPDVSCSFVRLPGLSPYSKKMERYRKGLHAQPWERAYPKKLRLCFAYREANCFYSRVHTLHLLGIAHWNRMGQCGILALGQELGGEEHKSRWAVMNAQSG
jgi:hypothetical protein